MKFIKVIFWGRPLSPLVSTGPETWGYAHLCTCLWSQELKSVLSWLHFSFIMLGKNDFKLLSLKDERDFVILFSVPVINLLREIGKKRKKFTEGPKFRKEIVFCFFVLTKKIYRILKDFWNILWTLDIKSTRGFRKCKQFSRSEDGKREKGKKGKQAAILALLVSLPWWKKSDLRGWSTKMFLGFPMVRQTTSIDQVVGN